MIGAGSHVQYEVPALTQEEAAADRPLQSVKANVACINAMNNIDVTTVSER